MGSENLHHRRKAKSTQDLSRRQKRRDSYAKVLIVCEGSKTEPRYFKELIDYYRLNSANVLVSGECGSSPKSVFEYAKMRYREEKEAGDRFNRVYCVFDKDNHESYAQTMALISTAMPKGVYFAITSVPCFEYWLLLHFVDKRQPYIAQQGNSAGNRVLSELKQEMPNYAKGSVNVFSSLKDRLDYAKQNATRILRDAKAEGIDNPTTHVHELVEYLQSLKKDK